ncbi:hypothetical protein AB0K21_02210 [Streptosporangium sp. NPDC049248]|uniref:hypothetical protein n=1 Tax=Streptosporangium sp. NPDC049248 TaxID=3155651 RepID=UPI00343E6165
MSTLADLDAARAAQQVQQHAPDWFVIWSLRHRRFEAWQCTDPTECRIVCASSAATLWDLMQQLELDMRSTSSPGDQPFTPNAVSRPALESVLLALPPKRAARVPGPHPSPAERSQP